MDDFIGGIIGIAIVISLFWGGSYLYQNFIGNPFKEVNGTVKYDDCREQINLKTDEYSKQNGTFVCNDIKTKSGKSMGGECVKIVTDNSNKCQTAYIYEKPADESCPANETLGVNDSCFCSYGYIRGEGGACVLSSY